MSENSSNVDPRDGVDDEASSPMSRRSFIGTASLGAAGLATASVGIGLFSPAEAAARAASHERFPGLRPTSVPGMGRFPKYRENRTKLPKNPFGGFDFALGYMAEGVQGIDPESPNFPNGQFSNTSGLFEHFSLCGEADAPIGADTGQPLGPVPSGVGGNEIPARSAEYWSRDILGQSNAAIRDDMWSAINWMRRLWGLDFDDPGADGFAGFGCPYQFPGSSDASNDYSLFSPRYAVVFEDAGEVSGFARFAPTLLAPDTAYTVVFRAGSNNPTYKGGIIVNGEPTKTTAASPEWPGKVRDGGFWGGIVQAMDVLPDIQAVSRGERYFSTPDRPLPALSGTTAPSPAKRGQCGGTTTNPQGSGP